MGAGSLLALSQRFQSNLSPSSLPKGAKDQLVLKRRGGSYINELTNDEGQEGRIVVSEAQVERIGERARYRSKFGPRDLRRPNFDHLPLYDRIPPRSPSHLVGIEVYSAVLEASCYWNPVQAC